MSVLRKAFVAISSYCICVVGAVAQTRNDVTSYNSAYSQGQRAIYEIDVKLGVLKYSIMFCRAGGDFKVRTINSDADSVKVIAENAKILQNIAKPACDMTKAYQATLDQTVSPGTRSEAKDYVSVACSYAEVAYNAQDETDKALEALKDEGCDVPRIDFARRPSIVDRFIKKVW